MKYTQQQIDRIEEKLNSVDVEELYREFIDECTPVVTIVGLSFTPSRIIEELDPIAFNCGVSDFSDREFTEVNGEYYLTRDVERIIEELEEE